MTETGIKGVQLFKISDSTRCAPAVYKPAIVAILNGTIEAFWDDYFVSIYLLIPK